MVIPNLLMIVMKVEEIMKLQQHYQSKCVMGIN